MNDLLNQPPLFSDAGRWPTGGNQNWNQPLNFAYQWQVQ